MLKEGKENFQIFAQQKLVCPSDIALLSVSTAQPLLVGWLPAVEKVRHFENQGTLSVYPVSCTSSLALTQIKIREVGALVRRSQVLR